MDKKLQDIDKEAQQCIQDENNIQMNTLDEPIMDTVVNYFN